MFKDAKVGERVWEFLNGWGTIIRQYNSNEDYNLLCPIRVTFDNGITNSYTLDGRFSKDTVIRLFWDEIKFEMPEKPFDLESELRKLKIVEFKKDEKNYFLLWDNDYGNIEYDFLYSQEHPLMKYFDKESIDNFMDNIEYKKITKEEFFKAYNIVFGGK